MLATSHSIGEKRQVRYYAADWISTLHEAMFLLRGLQRTVHHPLRLLSTKIPTSQVVISHLHRV